MRKGLFVFFISLCLASNLQAQQSTDTTEVTLQKAIDIALENSYQIDVAKNDLSLAKKQVRGEKADYLPSVSANASGNRNIGRTFNQNTGNITTQTNNSFRGSISADMPIFSGLENLYSLRSSKFSKESREKTLERARQDIIFDTANNYLQYILDKKILEIDRQTLKASKQTLEQVKAQVEVGSRPKVDLYNQQSTVATNENTVVNSKNSVQSSRLKLVQTMQVDPRKEYHFVIPKMNSKSLSTNDYNVDNLIAKAVNNRADLQSEKFNIKSLKNQLSATKGSLYPSLSLSGSISSSYSELRPFDFQDQFFDQNINKSIGLSLQIPIFNNLSRRLNVQTQEISYKNAKLNLEDTRLQIIQEVNQAYNDYESYSQQLKSSEKSLRAAKQSYESQKERYNVGAGTLVELSDANSQYVEAQSNKAQALFQLVFQEKLLDYYIGKINKHVSLQ